MLTTEDLNQAFNPWRAAKDKPGPNKPVPTPTNPPDSGQSGQQDQPGGTSDGGDVDESKKLP